MRRAMSKLFGIGNELSSVVQGFSDMLTLKIASLNTFMGKSVTVLFPSIKQERAVLK